MVLTKDGVALHVEIDLPAPEAAAAAAKGLTAEMIPLELPDRGVDHGYRLSLRCWVYQRRALKAAGYQPSPGTTGDMASPGGASPTPTSSTSSATTSRRPGRGGA